MKSIRKILTVVIVLAIVVCTLFASAISVSAENTISYHWNKMGVTKGTSGLDNEEYNSEGVVNLRCNYSSWDHAQEYLWLISNWSASHGPAALYLGDNYDMSKITSITFDYVTNGSGKLDGNKVSFTKDIEGTQVVATVQITEHTEGSLKNPQNIQMEITDPTYTGKVYLYIEYQVKMFVANLKVTGTDDFNPELPGNAGEPDPTMIPTATWDPNKEFNGNDSGFKPKKIINLTTAIISCSVIFVVMVAAIVYIWVAKKKQPTEQ